MPKVEKDQRLLKADRKIAKEGGPEKQAKKSLLIVTPVAGAAYGGSGYFAHKALSKAASGDPHTPPQIKRLLKKHGAGKFAAVGAAIGVGAGLVGTGIGYAGAKRRQRGLQKYPKSMGEYGSPGYTESYPEHFPIPLLKQYFKRPTKQLSARDQLNGIISLGEIEDKDKAIHKIGRVAKIAAIGGLTGRILAWHPVTGGKMNRATLIGAGIGAAGQAAIEHIAAAKTGIHGNPVRVKDESRKSTRSIGGAVATLGLLGATVKAHARAKEDEAQEFARTFMGGRVSEESAARQNAKWRRSQGMEGETFIPKFKKVEAAVKARQGAQVDEIGGSVEDKLERLARRAKGTPEGDVAARKLHEARTRQGKTFTGKIKKTVSSILSKIKARKVGSVVKAGKLLMSAREELNEIISFSDPDQKQKYHPVLGTIGALTLPGLPLNVIGRGTLAAVKGGSHAPRPGDAAVLDSLKSAASKSGVGIHRASSGTNNPAFFWRHNGESGGFFSKASAAYSKAATGSTAKTGIGISDDIRASLRPGVLAHEIGHAQQSKYLNQPVGHMIGKMVPGVGSLYVAGTRDEKRAKTAAIASALTAAPMLASEVSASVRGSKLLDKAGVKGLRRLSPAIGLPSYAAIASLPLATYATKKILGGYKQKETQMSARDQLSSIINLDDSRVDSRARGAAWGGSLIGPPGTIAGYATGSLIGGNKKKKLSSRDKALIIGSGAGPIGVGGAHILFPEHNYQARLASIISLAAMPCKLGGKINYPAQDFLYEMRKGLKKIGARKPSSLVRDMRSVQGLSAREELDSIINFKAVDLGETYGGYPCVPACDSSPSRKSYPTLYIGGRETDIDLPLSGKAVIKYKLRSKTTRQDEDGKKRHSADIEIQSIDPIEEKVLAGTAKPLKVAMSARDQLGNIISFGSDPRPRNPLGEFSGGQEGGISSNAIAAAYKQPSLGNTLTEGAAGGAGFAGATAGIGSIKALLEKVRKARK